MSCEWLKSRVSFSACLPTKDSELRKDTGNHQILRRNVMLPWKTRSLLKLNKWLLVVLLMLCALLVLVAAVALFAEFALPHAQLQQQQQPKYDTLEKSLVARKTQNNEHNPPTPSLVAVMIDNGEGATDGHRVLHGDREATTSTASAPVAPSSDETIGADKKSSRSNEADGSVDEDHPATRMSAMDLGLLPTSEDIDSIPHLDKAWLAIPRVLRYNHRYRYRRGTAGGSGGSSLESTFNFSSSRTLRKRTCSTCWDVWKYTLYDAACDIIDYSSGNNCYGSSNSNTGNGVGNLPLRAATVGDGDPTAVGVREARRRNSDNDGEEFEALYQQISKAVFRKPLNNTGGDRRFPVIMFSTRTITDFILHMLPMLHNTLRQKRSTTDDGDGTDTGNLTKTRFGFVLFVACEDDMVKGRMDFLYNAYVLRDRKKAKLGTNWGVPNPIYEYLWKSPLLIHFFAGNLDMRVVRRGKSLATPIPLGVDFHTRLWPLAPRPWAVQGATSSTPATLSVQEQSNRLHNYSDVVEGDTLHVDSTNNESTMRAPLPFSKRALRVVVDYSLTGKNPFLSAHERNAREDAFQHFIDDPNFLFVRRHRSKHADHHHTTGRQVPHGELLRLYGVNAFVLSPPGGGWDCHRHMEAIYRGAVPILVVASQPSSASSEPSLLSVETDLKGSDEVIAHEAYHGLPVVTINRVAPDVINASSLLRWRDEILDGLRNGRYNFAKLNVSYWVDLVRSKGLPLAEEGG